MRITNFFVALLTVVIYEMLMRLINPFGVSVTKVVITFLVWISCFIAISTFNSQYRKIRINLPNNSYCIFIAIIVWNLIGIFRSAFDENVLLTTLLGNNETSLALLVPFSLAFSADKINLRTINKFFVGLICIGIPAYLLFFALSNGGDNWAYNKTFSVIFFGVFFLVPIIPFQSGRIRLVIFLGSILLIYLAILTEYRIMIIRISLLYMSILIIYLYKWLNLKLILLFAMLSLLVPFYLFEESVVTGESSFQKYRPKNNDEPLTDDTRTFLYVEVLGDLQQNNELIIGKGSSGTYYSPYFDEYGGDTANRLSVEVGILALLLKGGLIAVLLNLAILFIAIYLALFRSNNYFVMSIGFMLVIHFLILFIANYLDYTIYNVALWFFIGVCLSKEMRLLGDNEIENLIRYKELNYSQDKKRIPFNTYPK